MSDEIHVKVNSYGPGRPLSLVYHDPTSGKKVAKSAGTTDPKEAERAAAVLEEELRSGKYASPSKTTWSDFREQFRNEKLAGMPRATQEGYQGALDHLERFANPDRLVKVTSAVLSRFSAALQGTGGLKDTTVAKILRHVKAALRWAVRVGLLAKAPTIEMPHRVKGQRLMKGRAITAEEFDRMLAVVPKVRPADSAAWVRYLTGLWLSGLRLGESLALSWEPDAPFCLDLSGRRPRFRIEGAAQKSGRDELVPCPPDFAEFIAETPESERVGPVFPLAGVDRVGSIVSAIGKRAGVVVDKAEGKYATAHDLRRSFGTRWAKRVMPAVLKRLMRHADISTTMGYYVDLDSDEMADELWEGWGKGPVGNTSGNKRSENRVIPRE